MDEGVAITGLTHFCAQVALKTLVVFHRLIRDGSKRFMEALTGATSVFNLAGFHDTSSPQAFEYNDFIRQYAEYLEERVCAYRDLRQQKGDFKQMGGNEICDALAPNVRLMEMLGACEVRESHLENNVMVSAVSLLLKDAFNLYRTSVEGITAMLGTYFVGLSICLFVECGSRYDVFHYDTYSDS